MGLKYCDAFVQAERAFMGDSIDLEWARCVRKLRMGARGRQMLWDLDDRTAMALIRRDCSYCGQRPALKVGDSGLKRNTIDRIDSSLGYIVGNCRTACMRCQTAKLHHSLESFIEHAERVASKSGRKVADSK